MKLLIFETKLEAMSDNSDNSYFDGSTSILAPVYIILALGVTLGVLFFG
ncbi:MAG: hypothetical protein ABJG68_08630 [Crocinitomicaceae bacterium]